MRNKIQAGALTSITDLQPYLDKPLDDAILQRWTVLPSKQLKTISVGGDWVITQASTPDPEMDMRWGIGPHGYGNSGSFADSTKPTMLEILGPAIKSYVAANNGMVPTDPSDLNPYLTTAEQRTALDGIIKEFKTSNDRDKAQMQKEVRRYVTEHSTP